MPDPSVIDPRRCEERSDAASQGQRGPGVGSHGPVIAAPQAARNDGALRAEPFGPLDPDHLDRLLALNNAHAAELSLLDAARLTHLLQQAFWAARVGDMDAFMLTLNQSADYDSPNHRWFRDRYPRFVYVDRVVVAPAARGRGLARLLYAGLLHAAAAAGHTAIMAEVNSHPPNPASDALHAALGFHEVGAASIHGGAKTVRYLIRTFP